MSTVLLSSGMDPDGRTRSPPGVAFRGRRRSGSRRARFGLAESLCGGGEAAVARSLEAAPVGGTAGVSSLDLASLDSVRGAAAAFLQGGRGLSVCVLDAGIMALPWHRTVDGFERQWQVDVLGHVLLCRLLLPAIRVAETRGGRIVHWSSAAHRRHPDPIDHDLLAAEQRSDVGDDRWRAHGRSELANILLSHELARRLAADGSGVTSNAVHPGRVATELLAKAGGDPSRGMPVAEGARTSIWVAMLPDVEGPSGGYYCQCRPVTERMRTAVSTSEEEGAALWAAASRDLGLGEGL